MLLLHRIYSTSQEFAMVTFGSGPSSNVRAICLMPLSTSSVDPSVPSSVVSLVALIGRGLCILRRGSCIFLLHRIFGNRQPHQYLQLAIGIYRKVSCLFHLMELR